MSPSSQIPPEPFAKVTDLGRYRLIAELARGGMGIVYLALVRGPAGFKKLLVVKELMPHFAVDEAFMAMFLDEARVAARLSHPNIVQTLEVGDVSGRPFIAMEYLEGQTLQRIVHRSMKRGTRLPLPIHLHALMAMLNGLHHAHEVCDFDGSKLRFVHRDVTPHNLFVTYAGEVKVIDFGIAKSLDSSGENTRTGVLKGKVGYMAPEQTRGEEVDRRADVYAAGVMLWEALTGRRMWKGENDLAVLRARMHDTIQPPSTVAANVPSVLERIAMRALADSPDARYATAEEMRVDLEAYLGSASHAGAREIGRYVTALFAEERAQMAKLVDEQMRELARARSADFGFVDLMHLPSPVTSVTPTDFAPPSQPPPETVRSPRARRGSALVAIALSLMALGAVAILAFVVMRSRRIEAKRPAPVATIALAAEPPRTLPPATPSPSVATSASTSVSTSISRAASAPAAPVAEEPTPAQKVPVAHHRPAHTAETPQIAADPSTSHKPIREIDLTDPYGPR